VSIVRRFRHVFLLYNLSLQTYLLELFKLNLCYLTEVKLQCLYYRFDYLSIKRLQRVLNQAEHNIDKKIFEYFTKYCHFCQKHSKSLDRFCFILQNNVEFNYCIIVDIIYISSSSLLYIVDKEIYFQTGR
jgi:hypothetical protein